eukprot:CAMPEP_0180510150 /NCGR_PEP_ID=MMETSP1036_2-20121128/50120_1 /TAXON_ID=632150 /ORGANISM="Azadinium spinosum, Strain 3D9" /LENGTH=186 /DNA_ID=CAMNT_0022520641 /DNA_START=15 /DNA_END=575 /DNA_ORIENTATION=-
MAPAGAFWESPCPGRPLAELEEENRSLRQAIAEAESHNAKLAAQRVNAEAQSLSLEAENTVAVNTILLDISGNKTSMLKHVPTHVKGVSSTEGGREMPLHSTETMQEQVSGGVTAVVTAIDEPEEVQGARQRLLAMSVEVERRLDDILSRRTKLQALVNHAPVAAERVWAQATADVPQHKVDALPC